MPLSTLPRHGSFVVFMLVEASIGGSVMFVVDLKRHYDGEDGLVGPFCVRQDAEAYVATLTDNYVRKYATVRGVDQP